MATPERLVIETLFNVVNKDLVDVPFKLNPAQQAIDNSFAQRMLIPKARQEGVTTYFLARSTVKCLGVKNTRAVLISKDAESTERMLNRVKYFIETMNGPKPIIKNSSHNEITFPKTNSGFFIGTAGSRDFGRGDFISDLHCSEVAYWEDPKRLMTGLLQAVPKSKGCISIESTGNGAGDWYHSQCIRALSGESSFKLVFLPWYTFPEYTLHLTPEDAEYVMTHLREDLNEPEMVRIYKLTPGQVAWRRIVIQDDMDGDLREWNKEYPSCLSDCFQLAAGGIFQTVHYEPTEHWKKIDETFYKHVDHPQPHLHYIVGADVGGGIGQDNSVAEVFCLETEEQVAEYISNHIEPDAFAFKLAELGRLFNEAYIGCESNNHGILTLKELTAYNHEQTDHLYPPHKIYRTPSPRSRTPKDEPRTLASLGVRTTARSKPIIIGALRKALKENVVIHSEILHNELSTFIETDPGKFGASSGCKDDTVMAAGMAMYVRGDGALTLLDEPLSNDELKTANDMSFESILREMTAGRKHNFFPSYLLK